MTYVLPLAEVSLDHLPLVGGKNASLGEMIRGLSEAGVRVPNGFALTTAAWHRHLEAGGMADDLWAPLDGLDVKDVAALARAARGIRERIAGAPLPDDVAMEARTAYEQLSREAGQSAIDVAVRSSATAEDLPSASFAGQQDSFLGVRGWAHLERTILACMASLFTDRAIVYRTNQAIDHRDVALSVGVQRMIRSDQATAGVCFTLDPESGFRGVVMLSAAYGLGELVVQGRVDPDEFWVHRPGLARGLPALVRRERGAKRERLVYGERGTLELERVPNAERLRFALDEEQVLELARMAVAIEEHYSTRAGHEVPMDIEWAQDADGSLWIVQARPETVHSRVTRPVVEVYQLHTKASPLLRGKSVGTRIGHGVVRHVYGAADLEAFQDGEVLVAAMTDPDWVPVLTRAAAVVTDHGGRTCHAAIVSRELGLPCVVGATGATELLVDGQEITVSCAEGDEGRVYEGHVPFTCEEVDPAELPEPSVPLMLNLANPDLAFRLAGLPVQGVGLMRTEFLVSSWIGLHPMAAAHPERVTDPAVRAQIRARTEGWDDPAEYFVERLAAGVGQIGAAFYPRRVIVRLSDFKTNEYAGLLGGADFELEEANPMIGFRGASRYAHPRYRDGFALECRALLRARERMGLDNLAVMVPFCRTLGEARTVLDELARHGLERGKNGLEVWVMCEIPNNVVLAEEFAELFDGFSIGSNDLTQLVLGVDRDSEILADVFDEQDPGVKRTIEQVIERAHACGTPVGICGQAPSDHPEFAAFLAERGIDSMSLNPDSIVAVARRLAKVEQA